MSSNPIRIYWIDDEYEIRSGKVLIASGVGRDNGLHNLKVLRAAYLRENRSTLEAAERAWSTGRCVMREMYARKEHNGLYTLRQERYRVALASGNEHPHDVCAIARSMDELKDMCVKHWPDADYDSADKAGAR